MENRQRWAVVAMLSIVVLLPSATLLWLTGVAVRNERAAIEQRLQESYQRQLELAHRHLEQHWDELDQQCAALVTTHSGGALFQSCVDASIAESVLVLGEHGSRIYPAPPSDRPIAGLNQRAWKTAEQLEFLAVDLNAAAATYAAIAAVETNVDSEALALIAYARCLAKSGKEKESIALLQNRFAASELREAKDQTGRSLWLDAQLRALQLLASQSKTSQETLRQRSLVRDAICDYQVVLPASQRLFAMNEFTNCFPSSEPFSTQHAEELAQQYVQTQSDWLTGTAFDSSSDSARQEDELHRLNMQRAPVALLIHESDLQKMASKQLSPWKTNDTEILLKPMTEPIGDAEASHGITFLPYHALVIRSLNPNALAESSRAQMAIYTLAGVMTVGLASAIALAIAFFVSRQLRLAQMKTDLAAVVTHELRTPLSSIRLLVDTLLEGTVDDPKGRSEYLKMIARENERLSRLIDNFLSYSKIQRGSQRYSFSMTDPGELVALTVETLNGKLSQEGCHFLSHVADDLPKINVDRDAMVNVLLNLLDNSLKFTGDDKRIELCVNSNSDSVLYHVIDNGVGLSNVDAKRVFDKFFQADSRLSRTHEGCGLGLSLVRSIVESHGGTVGVKSTVDQGSSFIVTIPMANPELAAMNEDQL